MTGRETSWSSWRAADILDMFDVVEAALCQLDDDVLAEVGDGARGLLEFAGFDYQEPGETRLVGLAEYLIGNGQWSWLAHPFSDDPGEPSCPNSHGPRVEMH